MLAGGGRAWLWLLAGAAAVLLVVVLYRTERKLISRRAGLMLLALRLIAAAVLVFALFEPIAAWSRQETVRGRVIVAADVSESMGTVDPGRTDVVQVDAELAHRCQVRRGGQGGHPFIADVIVKQSQVDQ